MRRSTPFALFSRLAVAAAAGGLGIVSIVSSAQAADSLKPAAASAAPGASGQASIGGGAASVTTPGKAGSAKAPDKKTRDAARKAYAEGEKAYAAGDFSAAYTAYARANELIPSAHAAYWAAKSLDQSGKRDDAIQAYAALVADPGATKIGEEKFRDAQTRLATLKASLVGEVSISAIPLTTMLSVDGVPQAGPLPIALRLAPGPHKLSFSAEGFDAKDLDLQVQAGSKVEQKVELQQHYVPPPPPPPAQPVLAPPLPPPPGPAEKHSKAPAFVTLGIAAGGAAVGAVFGIKALQSKSDFDSTPTSKIADDTERYALIADMAFGVAVTLGVTGIVLLTSDDDTSDAPKAATANLHLPPKSTFRVLPYVGRESGGAAARLTF